MSARSEITAIARLDWADVVRSRWLLVSHSAVKDYLTCYGVNAVRNRREIHCVNA